MRPRGRQAGPVQQIKYGYINANSPNYDTHMATQAQYLQNQQNLGLPLALDRAKQSQSDMSSLVNYYAERSPAANPGAYTVRRKILLFSYLFCMLVWLALLPL